MVEPNFAGHGGDVFAKGIVRIISGSNSGTGFLHKSGMIITAHHVVEGVANPTVEFEKESIAAKVLAADADFDLAILEPERPIPGTPIALSTRDQLLIGMQVATWGYPAGYRGSLPLLSVGYLSGSGGTKTKSGSIVRQWLVNAAFNSGNSGGPLIHVHSSEVIGVVVSKHLTLSPFVEHALGALVEQKRGNPFTLTKADGTTEEISEGRLIGIVLQEFRDQMQTVIGRAAMSAAVKLFLKNNGLDP